MLAFTGGARETAVDEADVVVVGAGVAGLVVAHELTAREYRVRILEARDRVGGRTLNAPIPSAPGTAVELGDQWVGPGQAAHGSRTPASSART